MSTKTMVFGGMFIGSTIGSYLPVLWGADLLSYSSIIASAIGSLIGIFLGYKVGKYVNG